MTAQTHSHGCVDPFPQFRIVPTSDPERDRSFTAERAEDAEGKRKDFHGINWLQGAIETALGIPPIRSNEPDSFLSESHTLFPLRSQRSLR